MRPPRSLLLALAVSCIASSPVVRAEIIADSSAEFSGVQGENGWYNGYRNYTLDGGGMNYDPAAGFIPFDGGEGQGDWDGVWQMWRNGAWDMNASGNGPWTTAANEGLHPNGENSPPNEEHWVIRRWVAGELSGTTPLAIVWSMRKQNTGGGNGVSGGIWLNGVPLDTITVAYNDGTGQTRTYYVNAKATDRIDLILTPVGPGGQRDDGADGSYNWMRIDTTIPRVPRQPDGAIFIPAGSPDTDGDGMADFWEQVFFPGDLTRLTATGDFDGDGVKDVTEMQRGTDPTKTDTDDDRLSDKVETGTGVFVSATDTGTSPVKPDTDGDGREDGDEVLGPPTSDPLVVDTDGDGYSDGSEAASGHDPRDPNSNPDTTAIADSRRDFTTTGTQGENGWLDGYRNCSKDGGEENYDPATAFIEFKPEDWTGSQWDLVPGPTWGPPWTELAADATHPNGSNNGDVHWTIRRWPAATISKTTPLALRWHVHKANPDGGNGVTGALYLNGRLLDKATIAFNDTAGVTRTYFANVNPGGLIDLILSPRGADGFDDDGADGSANWLVIDPTIPLDPRQPDGSVFIPVGAGDTDADGLPDVWENIYFPGDLTKLSRDGDFDQDGLKDPGEYSRDSDPTKPDTDSDGLPDLVETGTGAFVGPNDTGSSPKKADSDGDGISDLAETQRVPPTDPNKTDTDGDGFSDPGEIAWGTDPTNADDNPLSMVIANSEDEFSSVQGQNGWFAGYRDYTTDGKGNDYDPATDFIPFVGGEDQGDWDGVSQMWRNGGWDMNASGTGPWTSLASLGCHPNGANSPPEAEHWVIRRWVATELSKVTPVAIIWQVRKANPASDGVTGSLHINGKQVDYKAIGGTDVTGEIRRFYANLNPRDIVDLALTPEGPNGNRFDWSDGSITWLWVDTKIPREPRQPDGSLFIPANMQGVDADQDGLLDMWEHVYAPDLNLLNGAGDNDGDGLSNALEQQRDSNPLIQDTDGDGLSDKVETKTGILVDRNDTGSNPRLVDTDGDTRADGDEVNGTPTSDPNKADTDGDGFDDAREVASGHDPNDPNNNPNTTPIADSALEFSDIQGQNGWYYGYRNFTNDGATEDYDPVTGFTQFNPEDWNAGEWDLVPAPTWGPPWTELGASNTHPNGNNNGDVHWTIRRWMATELAKPTPLAIRWHVHKGNVNGGNGVTGALCLNGQLLDKVTIAGTDGTGVTHTYFANINPGDIVDLVLSPRGFDGSDNDGADSSENWMTIDPTIPPNPKQPDGTPFVPGGAKPQIVNFSYAGRAFTLTWTSVAGAAYTIEMSADLKSWTKLKSDHPSGGAQTSYTDDPPAPAPNFRFFRVLKE